MSVFIKVRNLVANYNSRYLLVIDNACFSSEPYTAHINSRAHTAKADAQTEQRYR